MNRINTQITAESVGIMGINKKDMPFILEALKEAKAKKEAFIVFHQNNFGLFLSEEVKRILIELEKNYEDGSELVRLMNTFNLGYIMGIRAERAKKKGGKI